MAANEPRCRALSVTHSSAPPAFASACACSTGEVIDLAWTQFSFPTGYYYDVLRGLEYLRSTGITPDTRMTEAIDLVASKRDANGRWPLENVHPDHLVGRRLDAEEGAAEGRPSRWNTLRALRVLEWYSAPD
ncbi:MAG: hypothetical protein ABIV47_28175 [Roseiflexaceae bacterium]